MGRGVKKQSLRADNIFQDFVFILPDSYVVIKYHWFLFFDR